MGAAAGNAAGDGEERFKITLAAREAKTSGILGPSKVQHCGDLKCSAERNK